MYAELNLAIEDTGKCLVNGSIDGNLGVDFTTEFRGKHIHVVLSPQQASMLICKLKAFMSEVSHASVG